MSSVNATANTSHTVQVSTRGIEHTVKWNCPVHGFDIWVTIPQHFDIWVQNPNNKEDFSQATLPVWNSISLITWCCIGTHAAPLLGTSLPDDKTAPNDYMSRIRAAQPALQSLVRGRYVPTKAIPS